MKTKLKKPIAALCLLASGLRIGIVITSTAFARLGVADARRTTGMLAVEAGDSWWGALAQTTVAMPHTG